MIKCGQGCSPECGTCIYFKHKEEWCTIKKDTVKQLDVCDRFYCKFEYQREGWI